MTTLPDRCRHSTRPDATPELCSMCREIAGEAVVVRRAGVDRSGRLTLDGRLVQRMFMPPTDVPRNVARARARAAASDDEDSDS